MPDYSRMDNEETLLAKSSKRHEVDEQKPVWTALSTQEAALEALTHRIVHLHEILQNVLADADPKANAAEPIKPGVSPLHSKIESNTVAIINLTRRIDGIIELITI